jgi:hypothetical protein
MSVKNYVKGLEDGTIKLKAEQIRKQTSVQKYIESIKKPAPKSRSRREKQTWQSGPSTAV